MLSNIKDYAIPIDKIDKTKYYNAHKNNDFEV